MTQLKPNDFFRQDVASRNPDIKNPNNSLGEAIVVSRPGVGFEGSPLIDKWEEAPKEGTYVLGSIDGVIQWIATEDCDE